MFSAVGKGVPAVWRLKVRIGFDLEFRNQISDIRLFSLRYQRPTRRFLRDDSIFHRITKSGAFAMHLSMHLAMHMHQGSMRLTNKQPI